VLHRVRLPQRTLQRRLLNASALGSIVARLLQGSWREDVPSSSVGADELELVTPLLLAVGSGALAWRRIRGTTLERTPAAAALENAYRVSALQESLHERALVEVFETLRAAGIEPLVFKGWFAAQLYPDPGLRPYGDHDVCVRPDDAAAAELALASLDASVDLHVGLSPHETHGSALDDEPLDGLFARSRLVPLDGIEIRVLAPEDHLALLCLHLAAHGAHRPLHLCDVAAAVEQLPDGFDWELCLGERTRRAAWIAWTVGLAHGLLGASLDRVPSEVAYRRMPRWLAPAVLRRWGTPTHVWWPRGRQRPPLLSSVGSFREAVADLRGRWPDPIDAAVAYTPPVWWMPKVAGQLAAVVFGVGRNARRLASG
jgi:hypothetical protein